MSFASVNFFAALSEEQKENFSKPVTKTDNKTSKKEDKNPKADATKARPKKADPNANNAAFKDKSAGRAANQKVPVNAEASAHRRPRSAGQRDDRRNKSGKKDTQKREKSGWGDNNKELQEEKAGEAIAKEDEAAEAAEVAEEQVDNTKTLEEYLKEKDTSGLNVNRNVRKPNEGADNQQWANSETIKKPELPANGPKKQGRNRARKEIVTLEPSLEHLPSLRSERGGDRRSNGRDNERRGGRKPSKQQVPKFDAASLPRLQ